MTRRVQDEPDRCATVRDEAPRRRETRRIREPRGFSEIELSVFSGGVGLLAGVDEAGRGPLAGPVVAAAVILPRDAVITGIADSKVMTEKQREEAAIVIRETAITFGIAEASAAEIDRINILEASIRAMQRAIEALQPPPEYLLVDGNRFRHACIPFQTVVKGDALCLSIGAASILAKTHRDALLREIDRDFPAYGFARHKGYATRDHLDAILRHGWCPEHRRSFTVKRFQEHQGELFDGMES